MKTFTGYKLVTQELTTHKTFKWELGVWKTATGKGIAPCTNGVLHYYKTPELAAFLNLRHAKIRNPRLFKLERTRQLGTDGLKCWCKKQRLIEELAFPSINLTQHIAFAIYCAFPTATESWKQWANNWLSGKDRSKATAYAAYAAYAAAAATAYANANANAAYAAATAHAAAVAATAHAAAIASAAYAIAIATHAAAAAAAANANTAKLLNKAAKAAMKVKV